MNTKKVIWFFEVTFFLLLLHQELKWSLSPHTAISWLNVYLQVAYLKEKEDLLIPKFPQVTFTHIAEVRVCMSLFSQTSTVIAHSMSEISYSVMYLFFISTKINT